MGSSIFFLLSLCPSESFLLGRHSGSNLPRYDDLCSPNPPVAGDLKLESSFDSANQNGLCSRTVGQYPPPYSDVDRNRLNEHESEEEDDEAWRNRESVIKFQTPDDDMEEREVREMPLKDIDPLGPPTVTTGEDHYLVFTRLFVRPDFQKQAKTNHHYRSDGGLAEWIIDDSCLDFADCTIPIVKQFHASLFLKKYRLGMILLANVRAYCII